MAISYTVGAEFVVIDKASATLKAIAAQFEAMDAQIARTKEALASFGSTSFARLDRSLSGAQAQMTRTADIAARTSNEMVAGFGRVSGEISSSAAALDSGVMKAIGSVDALGASFARVDEAIGVSVAGTKALRDAMGDAAVASREMAAQTAAVSKASAVVAAAGGAPPMLRRRGAGAHGGGAGGGDVHLRGNAPVGGGIHAGGNLPWFLAPVAAVTAGAYEEGETQSSAQKAFSTAGIIPGGALASDPRYQAYRKAIQDAMALTGAPLKELNEASLKAMQQLAGMPFDERLALLPDLLKASAVEARQKGAAVTTGMEAIVGLAHMRRNYGIDQIRKITKDFAYLSAIDPLNLESMTRAAGYAIPTLVSGGYDPDQIMLAMTAMQRGGILSTKAGTWLRELGIRSLPGTSLMSKKAFAAHEKGTQGPRSRRRTRQADLPWR